ncbi:MAG: sensor histidine kinase [Verrucomicrobiaceae bacterium]|nr:MAG: sensor histidine kinase [Verrucomicrobiaceae bacterium]
MEESSGAFSAPRTDGGNGLLARILRLPSQSVYSKALTLFVIFSLLLGMAVVLLTSEIILREFEDTERQEMIATLQRFKLMLARETRPLEISLADWLQRSESMENGLFVLPQGASLAALQFDFLSLADVDGRIRSTVFRDATARRIFSEAPAWTQWLSGAGGVRLPVAGFILLGDSLTAIACQKHGDGSMVVGGRIIDNESLAFLEGMFGVRVAFEPLRAVNVSGERSEPLLTMLARNEFFVQAEGPNLLLGHILIRGINGIPIGQIRLSQGRPLYAEGLQAVQIFLTVLTLAGGTLFLVMWILLDRTILARIRELTGKVESERDILPLQLDFRGSDELATLARRIEDLALQLDRARWSYRAVVEDQNEIICRFTPGFELTFANGIFQRTFRQSSGHGGFLQRCLPAVTFDFLSKKFQALDPDHPLDTFIHQILDENSSALWFRSTLRANFLPDGSRADGQWVAADITPQVQAQQQLQNSERELRTLSNRLMRLQDDERRKIARELHDSTAQSLSALEMNMSLLEPVAGDETTRRIVAETRQIARDCCMELRTISYLLHPPLLDEVGLSFALEWFADGFTKRTAIPVTLDVAEGFPRMDSDIETTLFRIVQESMGNIYRHSGAGHAWISLELLGGGIRLEIRDNGNGIPEGTTPTAGGGVGLAGMRERLAQLGGELEIRSSIYGVSIVANIRSHVAEKEKNPDC